MDDFLKEISNLDVKAYKQGYNAGLKGLPWSEADWEEEFLPSYRRGYEYGKMELEISTPKK